MRRRDFTYIMDHTFNETITLYDDLTDKTIVYTLENIDSGLQNNYRGIATITDVSARTVEFSFCIKGMYGNHRYKIELIDNTTRETKTSLSGILYESK